RAPPDAATRQSWPRAIAARARAGLPRSRVPPPGEASPGGDRSFRVSRKPNSVGLLRGDHLSGAPVSGRLDATDPGVIARRDTPLPLYAVLLQVGFTEPDPSPDPLVRSYRTVSPLPATPAEAGARWRS